MKILTLITLLVASSVAVAHQPVMDMAPRWANGYGFQTRFEHADSRSTLWLEGVYTFRPEFRLTAKIPFSRGDLGNVILGVPLKRYRNERGRTSNWGITPSVQLPTGPDSNSDFGLSLSYSAESLRAYQLYDLYAWDDRVGIDINVGLAFPRKGGGMFAIWDISGVASDHGDRVLTGPVYVVFRGNTMFRAEYKVLAYDHDDPMASDYVSIGIGFVF
ncbi:MAG: hypothetical protein R3288_10040 [Woeseiaceae bacterium]|nr:hypothetical protein [Woeseiaceae bacterium]